MTDSYQHCQNYVRQHDKDRFLAGLFAHKNQRKQLYSLYAFDLEINKICERTKDPFPGEIRLQWWRDVIDGKGRGSVRDNPVADALLETISLHQLPHTLFLKYLDAKIFDLYEDPMPNLDSLHNYLTSTSAALFEMATLILSKNEPFDFKEACKHAGIACGLTKLLRAFPRHSRRQKLFLPSDVLKRQSVQNNDIFSQSNTSEIHKVLKEMRLMVRNHAGQFTRCVKTLPKVTVPAFLPLCLIEPYLQEMEQSTYHPFGSRIEINPLRRFFLIWKTAIIAKGKRAL